MGEEVGGKFGMDDGSCGKKGREGCVDCVDWRYRSRDGTRRVHSMVEG